MKNNNGKIEYGFGILNDEEINYIEENDFLGNVQMADYNVDKYDDVYVDAPTTLSELLW